MYESHFGLRQRPFRATPNSECYYPGTSQEQALADLLRAVHEDEGLALLTGEPGTGKTLLCHCLLERLGEEATIAFLTNSHVSDCTGLLQAILYDLSLPYQNHSQQELRLALTDFLLRNYADGMRTVLVFDEAQNLAPDLLEELRLLGNLEGRNGKAVQVVLSAQPQIQETLRRPELASLHQRLGVRPQLEPFSVHEAADYLVHQLRAAGGQPEKIITDEAIDILARGTQGLPRLLNRAANQALCLAFAAEASLVDAEAALDTLVKLDLCLGDEEAEPVLESTQMGELEEDSDRTQATEPSEMPTGRETGRLRRLFTPTKRPTG